jgi:hypothetical protein
VPAIAAWDGANPHAEIHAAFLPVQPNQQRHDVEIIASVSANLTTSTNFESDV